MSDKSTGRQNTNNHNTGKHNTGDHNAGNWNTGNWNTGNWNTGNWNTGNCNAGIWNVGDLNVGNFNIGAFNTGDSNVGWHNIGDKNTGDYNLCDRSTGCFNTQRQPFYIFDKPSSWTFADWRNSAAYIILSDMPKTRWIPLTEMTDDEKIRNPNAKTTGGYLDAIHNGAPLYWRTSRQKWWNKLSIGDKNIIKKLPNFDPEIFKKVTGIDVEEEK